MWSMDITAFDVVNKNYYLIIQMNQYNEEGEKEGWWEFIEGERLYKGNYKNGKRVDIWESYIGENLASIQNFVNEKIIYTIEYNKLYPYLPKEKTVFKGSYNSYSVIYHEAYDIFGNLESYWSRENEKYVGTALSVGEIIHHKKCLIHPIIKTEAVPTIDCKERLISLKDINTNEIIGLTVYDKDDNILIYSDCVGNYFHHQKMNVKCPFKLEEIFKECIIPYKDDDPRLANTLCQLKQPLINNEKITSDNTAGYNPL